MSKRRSNPRNSYYNMDSMCIECNSIGSESINNYKKGWYMIKELNCPICKKITRHIICKNLEELKAKLIFEYNLNNEDKEILKKLEKVKRK